MSIRQFLVNLWLWNGFVMSQVVSSQLARRNYNIEERIYKVIQVVLTITYLYNCHPAYRMTTNQIVISWMLLISGGYGFNIVLGNVCVCVESFSTGLCWCKLLASGVVRCSQSLQVWCCKVIWVRKTGSPSVLSSN